MKIHLAYILLNLGSFTDHQTPDFSNFIRYVGRNYQVSEAAKYDCTWMYAIVMVNTDSSNKIIKYECLNDVSAEVKQNFKFLIGYKFSKQIKINKNPVIFYFSIENSEVCKPRPGDKIFYSPNEVVGIVSSYLIKIRNRNPNTIIIPDLIKRAFYPTER